MNEFASTRQQIGLVAREQLADRLGVGHVDAGAEARHPDREDLAVALVPTAQGVERPPREARHRERSRARRAGR